MDYFFVLIALSLSGICALGGLGVGLWAIISKVLGFSDQEFKTPADPLKIGFSGLLVFILASYALDSIHLRDCMETNLTTFDVEKCVEYKVPDY